jgi:hypothetical protein
MSAGTACSAIAMQTALQPILALEERNQSNRKKKKKRRKVKKKAQKPTTMIAETPRKLFSVGFFLSSLSHRIGAAELATDAAVGAPVGVAGK